MGQGLEPTDVDLFPIQTYPGASPAVGIPQPTDEFTVRANLEEHFQRFVDARKMKRGLMRRLLERFDDPKQQALFVDPATGQFEPHLMAMVLATAGTPGEGAIKALLDGQNPTARPAKVVYGELNSLDALAKADIVKDAQGGDQWLITADNELKQEPFPAAAAFIAHESMRQDLLQGQDEEIAAKSAEINVWKVHLLINPQLASLRYAGNQVP